MRGRKGNPAAQATKGHPGKRRTKVERLLADGEARAESLAALVRGGDLPISPPAFLARFKGALRFWDEFAPLLFRIHSLQAVDVPRFAQLCVAYDQWLEAIDELQTHGKTHLVKTVSGDSMRRLSPWVKIEIIRFGQCQELFEQFGIGALDRAKLLRDRATLAPGLWLNTGAGQPAAPQAETDAPSPSHASPIGGMDLFDSRPPGDAPLN